MASPPTERQLNFAKDIARKRNEPLPDGVALDGDLCSAYIAEKKDWIPVNEAQASLAKFIYQALEGKILQKEYDEALASKVRFQAFVDRYRDQADEQSKINKCRNILNELDVIPRSLRDEINLAATSEDKLKLLQAHKDGGQGFSGLDPASLNSIAEKLSGYWVEGLLSSAFESLGKLDNLLGKDPKAYVVHTDLERALERAECPSNKLDADPVPTRHLVLKLVTPDDKKDPIVVSALALSPIKDPEDPRGFRWGQAVETIPRFNRNYMGEAAKVPGILLDNVDAFDAWALESSVEVDENDAVPGELSDALSMWDAAFDILGGIGLQADPRGRGIRGWLQRFESTKHQTWQVKKRRPVFVLVDASAASGATRNVSMTYRQILGDSALLAQEELKLFRNVATVSDADRCPYEPEKEAAEFAHMMRYFGHMDALKDGKREAFPLDPAQRDALIALTTTGRGQVLAVNGPPGTGKTSLMRGVIASLWIDPLLRGGQMPDCPMILACAATNQAVTNVISSFDETPGPSLFNEANDFDGGTTVTVDSRWLPHLVSYGWYAPANAESQDVQRDYQAYQFIGRKRPNMPWTFYGKSQSLNTLSADRAETLYLECAARFFGVGLSTAEVVKRLRQQIYQGALLIQKIQKTAEEWQDHLEALAKLPAWTGQHERQRRALHDAVAAETGPAGRYSLLQSEISRLDKAIKSLLLLQADNQPDERQVDVLLAGKKDGLTPSQQKYRQIRRLDRDLESLSEKIEALRHATLIQRIGRSVAAVVSPTETKRKWQELSEAMLACGLPVTDQERPNFADWGDKISGCRAQLETELRMATTQILVARARELAAAPSDSAGASPADWRTELLRCIDLLQTRRVTLLADQTTQKTKYDRDQKARDEIEALYGTYSAARSEALASKEKLLVALEELGEKLSSNHAIVELLGGALKAHGAATRNWLAQHRRDLIRHLQDWLDINLRPRMFHLAARYWEGRFVLSRKSTHAEVSKDATFSLSSEAQLREMAMLAPVFVVTAFSAPKLMRRQLVDIESDQPPYLFGEADLLIVDEAGQGTPEIGASAFLFAKRAIVVGDVEQLDPVWSHEEAGDRLLVQRFGLGAGLDANKDPYEALKPDGILLANGSVMRMAQRVSWRSTPGAQAAGLTLTNHYRCVDPIIEICNRMVYRGALRVATRPPEKFWRPELKRLGYLVIDAPGDTKNPAGSRSNIKEATTIARWLKENEAGLLKHFSPDGKKDLADIVAIVTPFKGQKSHLKKAVANAFGYAKMNKDDEAAIYNRMTIDTVHSLQGSEKSVVIFSMVESSTPSEPQFYDKGTNLINVAISRAKEMFIVALSQNAVDYARNLTQESLHKPSDYLWQAAISNGSRLNSRHVVVVESPNKSDTIHAALGGSMEWEIVDTGGHIADLAPPEDWDIAQATTPVWGPLEPNGEKALTRLQTLWPGLASLYLATDPDPEGEAISWHLLRTIQERQDDGRMVAAGESGPAVKRMRFHRLDAEEIRRAQREAGDGLDAGMVKAALARNFLDRIISTCYARRLGLSSVNGFLAGVGRVQLGILDLVHKASSIKPQFGIAVDIPVPGETPLSTRLAKDARGGHDGLVTWSEESEANAHRDRLVALFAHQETRFAATWSGHLAQHDSYPAVNTARLLALAYRALGMAPARAMAELQALYEGTAQHAPTAAISPPYSSLSKAFNEDEMEGNDA